MTPHSGPEPIANLARAFLAGGWEADSLRQRGRRACPNRTATIRSVVRRIMQQFGSEAAPPIESLIQFLRFDQKIASFEIPLVIGEYFGDADALLAQAPTLWRFPRLATERQLADWLGVRLGDLEWLADVQGRNQFAANSKLHHYVCRWLPRRSGRFRLLESPKPKLKAIQRKILHEILDRIPPHPAAHGFRIGHSILSFAAPHANRQIVIGFDLRDFFASVRASRVHAIFRSADYPASVARLLTGLCTSIVAREIWDRRPNPRPSDDRLGNLLRSRHLPQGAPTSPALANLCAFRLDVRLSALAESMQANFTRYADDLAFSGGEELGRAARRFQTAVAVIAADEGFELHFQKSRFMRQGVRQQLAGVVVNHKPNIRRTMFDQLKAILTNCVRHGPESQNRDAHADFRRHLLGRIAHVEMIHPERGAKLRAIFERIRW